MMIIMLIMFMVINPLGNNSDRDKAAKGLLRIATGGLLHIRKHLIKKSQNGNPGSRSCIDHIVLKILLSCIGQTKS